MTGPPHYVFRALNRLCKHFKIKEPVLKWTRTSTGICDVYTSVLYIGPYCWRGVIDSLLHEFAHFYNFDLYRLHTHNPTYWECLDKVVTYWYRNPRNYNWRTEYKSGHNYALRKHYCYHECI